MTKLIRYAQVSTRPQSTDRQEADLLATGVRRDDLYVDQGISGARASQPQFDRALGALEASDMLVITTLDRLGRSTQNMLGFAQQLRYRGAGLRVLNLGGGDVDTSTPIGSICSPSWRRWHRWSTTSSEIGSLTRSANVATPGMTLEGAPGVSPIVKFGARCAWLKVESRLRRLPETSECLARRFIEGLALSPTSHSEQPSAESDTERSQYATI